MICYMEFVLMGISNISLASVISSLHQVSPDVGSNT